MKSGERTALTAWSVAGGGWLIRGEGAAEWVDVAACRVALPEETARIAALGRELILRHHGGVGDLLPEEVAWLLDAPRRVACLVDFLAAPEDPARVQTTPISITLAATGRVRWRFGSADATPSGRVAWAIKYRWPMAMAAAVRA